METGIVPFVDNGTQVVMEGLLLLFPCIASIVLPGVTGRFVRTNKDELLAEDCNKYK